MSADCKYGQGDKENVEIDDVLFKEVKEGLDKKSTCKFWHLYHYSCKLRTFTCSEIR